jgi:hypothetical protein
VLNVEEEAIEVINCKLIWIPAGNKKKQEKDISWLIKRTLFVFGFEKKIIMF